MSNEEAMDWLINNISIDVRNTKDFDKDVGCLYKCKEALEKLVPKKPKQVKEITAIKKDGSEDYLITNCCPRCSEVVHYLSLHCCDCGQSLDWSKE